MSFNRPLGQSGGRPLDEAQAPYNFVSLPEKIVPYPLDPPPAHNSFDTDRFSGYFDVLLQTETPLYIRGPLTVEEARAKNDKEKEKAAKGEKIEKTAKDDKPNFFYTDESTKRPVIPGSSLRGMIRSLFEIVMCSKIQPLNNTTKIYYRAVAARRADALGQEYSRHMGGFGKNIRAGYLKQREDRWYIQPARRFGEEYYAKVKDKKEVVEGVKGIKHLNDKDYKLAHFDVTYTTKPGKRGPYIASVRSSTPEERTAVLVCTGNMKETSDDKPTPRKNFSLVLLPDPNARELPISPQAVIDYRDGLSPFLVEQFGTDGILKDGKPVFYLEPEDDQREVTQFGHNPYFRLAAQVWDTRVGPRAVTPADRVTPPELHQSDELDYAEAVFGFVREGQSSVARAGRVSVTQAELVGDHRDIYEREFNPRILGSPKPTAFMHYLEQKDQVTLSDYQHYASSDARIRGHKLYWRKRLRGIQDVEASAKEMEDKKSQYTRIQPVKAGARFNFRVYFDNLDEVELGALAWVLSLGDDPNLRHMLGMGKPYGLGVVRLTPQLTLIDRKARYTALFDGDQWQTGEDDTEYAEYIEAFKADFAQQGVNLDQSPRMQELRALLRLWQDEERLHYMALERFKDRPVLPKALNVARKLKPAE